jgi:small subunit ribosomal protein S9
VADATTQPFVWGTGRRKSAVARVRIKAGTGNITVNEKPFEEFFRNVQERLDVTAPLRVTDTKERYDVWVNVLGGGKSGQAGAIRLGLARALKVENPGLEPVLREHGLLTRDSRMIERKKYGLHKARRAVQFSKR